MCRPDRKIAVLRCVALSGTSAALRCVILSGVRRSRTESKDLYSREITRRCSSRPALSHALVSRLTARRSPSAACLTRRLSFQYPIHLRCHPERSEAQPNGVEGPLLRQESMPSRREHRYTVYILGSSSGTLYVGITSNLQFRVSQHKEHAFRGFTAKYEVDRLHYFETYGEVLAAIHREKQLKGWRREKKNTPGYPEAP